MTEFRDIFAKADRQIIERAGDAATLDGNPVRGELSTPIDQSGLSRGMTGIQQQTFRLSDDKAAGAELGLTLECLGVEYEVDDIIPEGTGMTTLVLKVKP